MRKAISLLLALACLASILVIPVSAKGMDKETIQKAVVETALAYYRKGIYVQYDSTEMTKENRSKTGPARLCSGDSPEMAAKDYTLYTVCSDWCYDVYYNAFGYKLSGSARTCLTFNLTPTPTSNPMVVLKYGAYMDDVHTRDRQEFIKKCQEVWEPGDVIVIYSRKEDGTAVGGHAMLYIGDYDNNGKTEIIHSVGKKVNLSTGVDSIEAKGSIRIDDAYDHLFNPDTAKGSKAVASGNAEVSSHNVTTGTFTELILLRPRNDPSFPKQMTASAQSRLKYPGLDIDRSTDLNFYNSTQTGSEITVTVTLKNTSKTALEGITVTESAPRGAIIVEGSATNGGAASAAGAAWTVSVPAGGEVKLSYKVKVTAARGQTVTLPGGAVDQIPTRELSYTVSGKPLSKTAALDAVAKDPTISGIRTATRDETDFANEFYESVLGVDLGIPTDMTGVIDALLTVTNVPNATATRGKMLTPKENSQLTETGKYLKSMILPEHLAGQTVYLGTNPDAMDSRGRVREFKESAYIPGDIFLCMSGASTLSVAKASDVAVYIYLGNGRVATQGDAGVKITTYEKTIARMLRMNVMIGLRPSLARDDITATATEFKFTDVMPSAWYYSYVKSLVVKGVVSGMTETSFVPNGNLTYGQALKLVTLAAGEAEQTPTTSHWASGYLALAQKKGWLTSDVDLNANISRLAFCRIAAKAAKISQQPAANPFADTRDASVLALYKAGIINGMTESTFQPEGLLTRAQISKIIFGLLTLA